MKKWIFIFFILSGLFVSAQPQVKNKAIRIGYLGDMITHPGMKIGYEMELKNWQRENKKSKKRYINLFLLNSLGFYNHPNNHKGLIILPEIGIRKIRQSGFLTETILGMGYHRSFIGSPVYTVNDGGEIEESKSTGQSTLYLSSRFTLGKDYYYKDYNKPIAWQLGPGISFRTPYNKNLLPALHFQASIKYYLNHKRIRTLPVF